MANDKLKVIAEIIPGGSGFYVVNSDNVGVGNQSLTAALQAGGAETNKKADKTYVDTELGKKSDKTYVDEELAKKADKTTVSTLQTQVNTNTTKTANLQTQIDTLVIEAGGDSNPEVVQARIDENGTTHTTLKDRIDSSITEVKSDLSYLNDVNYNRSVISLNPSLPGYYTEKDVVTGANFYHQEYVVPRNAISISFKAKSATSHLKAFLLLDENRNLVKSVEIISPLGEKTESLSGIKYIQANYFGENYQEDMKITLIDELSEISGVKNEVSQARTDENGAAHTTLKDRIDSSITEVKNDLNMLNSPDYSLNVGYISYKPSTGYGQINTNYTDFNYTSPILLKAGETIKTYCFSYTGGGTYGAVISIISEDGTNVSPVVICDSSDAKWYEYTQKGFDTYVSICCSKSSNLKIYVDKNLINNTDDYVTVSVTKDIIQNNKSIINSKDFYTTSVFSANKGDVICVEGRGYFGTDDVVCNLASCDSDGNILECLLFNRNTSFKSHYKVAESGHFRACFDNRVDYSLSISKFNKNLVNHAMLGYVRGNAYSGVTAVKAESGHFHVSSPIFLEKGDKFVYGCTNYYGEVVTLAESDAKGNPIKFIRTGYDEKREYQFVANKDMYVIMSYNDTYDYYGYIAESDTRYVNKTWCVFGDSLTEKNLRALMNYHDFVAQDLGINVINYGLSGSGFKNGGHWYTRIANITEDFDVCTLFGSFNDLSYEIGNMIDSGTETLCGCINTTLDLFYSTYPNKKIGIITPTPWSVSYDNGSILTTKSEQYVNALMTIAKMRGIPCLDLYHSSGLRPWNENFRYNYYREYNTSTGQYVQDEGTHPNSKGQEYFAYMVEDFVKNII